ncbi:membrane-bound lytic murein transglycosylase MltF [Erwinia pyrifoliae]|uniref:Membrane-bound lytic murein transglycosylase F n=1 Tax=Erwinia pyrifoliae TaxID=79967 RepID=A0ABY5XAI2_ERWPY|nr:membrane-bound lytic murein transglycosylase MltF [Erwinia pyrifoliae]AUX73431.1 membrane-bound lytic murein transglycosylase MltF [Erwinia pyrifoliae]MCA8876272.1 membrane-bound lytic murein transglycosylase MltF [Erwinia pyrifoliae]UWS28397.1 membrane-bound lytic murein transglycosylase MltF [Erwinia pyrifoliae]UWS34394.1 membrane-bound lytic murein transglycosylase MltF [Erwinia pyrifoliae]UXK11394.1 membrane-bound lytic murein transglycosylase MltF [Erwinia pyrifoliae]
MKRLKFNYLLIGLITVLLALALWPSIPWYGGSTDRIAQIKSRGVLRISTINSPLTYYTVKQSPAGMDYELAKRFADYLGVRLAVTVRPNLADLFEDLADDKADVLAAGLIYNSERLKRFRAGPAYYSVSQQLVYRIGTPRPKNLGDLKGRLTVASGSAYLSSLCEVKDRQYADLDWAISTDRTPEGLLQAVADGKLDYTIADSVSIGLMQRIHPQLAVAFDITDEEAVTWYMRQEANDSLSAAILDFFSRMSEEGAIARLDEKYLGHVGTFDYVDTRTFLRSIDETLPDIRRLFEKYAREIDWRLLAAISYQESHWNPQATSPTGVRGMMMLTRNTAESLNVSDRTDPEQSIRGGSEYLLHMMEKVPPGVPEDERIWFALAAYNMGYAHMLDARKLTEKQKGNPNSWADVKVRLPMLSQKRYYSQTTYGYARGQEAYNYVENIRKYQLSLVGYLQDQERKLAQKAVTEAELSQAYPAVEVNTALNPTGVLLLP